MTMLLTVSIGYNTCTVKTLGFGIILNSALVCS